MKGATASPERSDSASLKERKGKQAIKPLKERKGKHAASNGSLSWHYLLASASGSAAMSLSSPGSTYRLNLWSSTKMWLMVKTSDWRVASLTFGFSWHSHTVIQCHPILASRFCSSLSLLLLRSIFACQKAVLLFGMTKSLQPSWPCQKQPLTKMTVRYLRITMSGCPGSRGWFTLYRNPCANR